MECSRTFAPDLAGCHCADCPHCCHPGPSLPSPAQAEPAQAKPAQSHAALDSRALDHPAQPDPTQPKAAHPRPSQARPAQSQSRPGQGRPSYVEVKPSLNVWCDVETPGFYELVLLSGQCGCAEGDTAVSARGAGGLGWAARATSVSASCEAERARTIGTCVCSRRGADAIASIACGGCG